MVELKPHQSLVLDQLRPGVILQGGVGSGKSITGLAYFYTYELKSTINPITLPKQNVPLYIITTAKKRDSLEWDKELSNFCLSQNSEISIGNIKVVVDSWNNIGKYSDVEGAFFLFDEQRLVGSGAWVKAFLKITKKNKWMLLTATPGDAWIDYVPVFIANGFYKNKTQFVIEHVTYSRFSKYPRIDSYRNVEELIKHRDAILVKMPYEHHFNIHREDLISSYDEEALEKVVKKRWNIFTNKPIRNASELVHVQREIINKDPSKLEQLEEVYKKHNRVIVFYNFNYELFLLREFLNKKGIHYTEWNGHKHEDVPSSDKWIYLVQYTAGAEGWECITTNTIFFYSPQYSFKKKIQAEGRIARLNTPFNDLFYKSSRSNARIDRSIIKANNEKRDFNEKDYVKSTDPEFASKTYPLIERNSTS